MMCILYGDEAETSRVRTSREEAGDYKLKTPPARFRLCMGKTTTREIPRPTVIPIHVDTSCSAVWKPER